MNKNPSQYELVPDSECEDGDEFPGKEVMELDIAEAMKDFGEFAAGTKRLRVTKCDSDDNRSLSQRTRAEGAKSYRAGNAVPKKKAGSGS